MMTPTGEKVGFIGVGTMGGAMVSRIVDAGFPTVLWARTGRGARPVHRAQRHTAATPAALAAAADLVGVCVWNDDDVREVVAGEHGVFAGAAPGTVVAIHSTILPSTCRELADLAAARDVFVLDAPVTGGPNVALDGALTVAVGGNEDALARAQPVFDTFASTVIRLGDVGAGQVAKLLNNAVLAANLAVADDALTLGEELGLDATVLAEFLRLGSGRSYAVDVAMMIRASDETRAGRAAHAREGSADARRRVVGAGRRPAAPGRSRTRAAPSSPPPRRALVIQVEERRP